ASPGTPLPRHPLFAPFVARKAPVITFPGDSLLPSDSTPLPPFAAPLPASVAVVRSAPPDWQQTLRAASGNDLACVELRWHQRDQPYTLRILAAHRGHPQ